MAVNGLTIHVLAIHTAYNNVIQELLRDKAHGTERVNSALEAGEALYANTSADGREAVRAELRRLRSAWDDLYDDVMTSQRQLEVNLVQWSSFEDSYDQVEAWLNKTEVQLAGKDGSCGQQLATADEKKAQLATYKVVDNVSRSIVTF